MGQTITVRLTKRLAEWLEEAAARTGISKGQIVRDEWSELVPNARRRAFCGWRGRVGGPATRRRARDLLGGEGNRRHRIGVAVSDEASVTFAGGDAELLAFDLA